MSSYYDDDTSKNKEKSEWMRRHARGSKSLTVLKKKTVVVEVEEDLTKLEQKVKDKKARDSLANIRKERAKGKLGSSILRGMVQRITTSETLRPAGKGTTETKVDGVMIANKHVDREVLNEND